MKRLAALITALLLCVGLAACGRAERQDPPPSDDAALVIAVASDLHYLAPSLTDGGALFRAVVEQGDGKLMLYSEEILEAFTAEMLRLQPDLLILSGDLSFNGEYDSHTALADKLLRIEKGGTRVLVIPGNHDLNNMYAFSYSDMSYRRVKSCSPAEFREIYREFGYAGALSLDEASGSYVCAPRADLRILMLDTNSAGINSFPADSLVWLEEQLADAERSGARVLAVCHQNLLIHNDLFIGGYRIPGAIAICRLLERYGVMASLSGHMHIQHLAREGFPELLSSALSLPPNRFGLLRWDGASLRYEAASADVARWARENGSTDEALLSFPETARDFFYQNFYRQIAERYADSDLPPETVERLAVLFAETNLAYFTGEPVDREALAEGLAFWKEADPGSSTAYLESILADPGEDALHVTLWEKVLDGADGG